MPRKRTTPKTDRPAQRKATTDLVNTPRSRTMTLAQINAMRRNGGSVRVGLASRVRGGEYGASGTLNVFGQIWNEDYNSLFDGKNGLIIFDQMYRSDAQIGAATDIIQHPIRAARWFAEYPKDATSKEKEITDLLNEVLFEFGDWPDGESWDFYLRHLLLRVPFGFGLLEPIWTFDEDRGILRWRRLAPRLPRTVDKFIPNEDGTLAAIVQYVAEPGTAHFEYKTIPSDYALISCRERLGDNFFGQSIYRRLYKHWFYKDDAYRIDGVRLDRYGVGIPVAKIEEGHILEDDELDEIELTLIALRSHERAYIIEPPKVSFRIMTPENGTGGVTGLMESVEHHDSQIVRGVLATFLSDHSEGLNTNRTRTLADIFMHALRGEAKAIAGDIRSQLVRRWCRANFDMTDVRVPEVQVQGIGETPPEVMAEMLSTLVTAKVITAEDDLEDALRKMLGLGPLPDGWKRGETKPPPLPGEPGGPAPTPTPTNGGARPSSDAQNREGAPEPSDDPNELSNALKALANEIANQKPPVVNMPPITITIPNDDSEQVIERDDAGRIKSIRKGRAKK